MSKCWYCKKQGFVSWKIGIIKIAVKESLITCMKSICNYKIKVSRLAMPIGSNRTTYAAWNQTKPCKSWKAVCMLLRVMNGNQIMIHYRRHRTSELIARADTATLPVSETNVFKISCLLCMSFCFVILYVTIWCKDNKLIIYLSIYPTGKVVVSARVLSPSVRWRFFKISLSFLPPFTLKSSIPHKENWNYKRRSFHGVSNVTY